MTAESENVELGREHQLHGVQPVLPVADVAASAEFFRKILGFQIDFIEGNPPIHARVKVVGDWGHPIYIHLSLAEPDDVFPSGETRIHVGRDLDGLFEAYRRLGAEVVSSPVSQP